MEVQEMFNNIMSELPANMRLSQNESEKMLKGFTQDIQDPLQELIDSAVNKINKTGNFSKRDEESLIADLVRLMVPYMTKVAKSGEWYCD